MSEIRDRLTLRPPASFEVARRLDLIREAFVSMGELAEQYAVPKSREWSLALTKIEEATYWAIASVVRSSENVKGD